MSFGGDIPYSNDTTVTYKNLQKHQQKYTFFFLQRIVSYELLKLKFRSSISDEMENYLPISLFMQRVCAVPQTKWDRSVA